MQVDAIVTTTRKRKVEVKPIDVVTQMRIDWIASLMLDWEINFKVQDNMYTRIINGKWVFWSHGNSHNEYFSREATEHEIRVCESFDILIDLYTNF